MNGLIDFVRFYYLFEKDKTTETTKTTKEKKT